MGWGDTTSLAIAVLTSPPDQAAKLAFVDDLKANHRNNESPAGRPDGENWNNGILSVADYPHYGLVDGIRDIGYRMYEVRAQNAE